MFDEYKELAKMLLLFTATASSMGYMMVVLTAVSFPINYVVALLPLYIVISKSIIEHEKTIKRTEGCTVLPEKGSEVLEERKQEAVRYMRKLKKKQSS